MRREDLYLTDIVEAADSIQEFLEGVAEEEFLGDDLLRSAVLHKLTIIGEAAARLPRRFRDAHPQMEWNDIVAFRNFAVHAYFAIDWRIVWVAATSNAPALRSKVATVLSQQPHET